MKYSIKYFPTGKEELRKYVSDHPWCAPAQLHLLHSLKGDPGFDKQALKTGLFFNNTQWLNWQLNHVGAGLASALPEPLPEPELLAFEPLHMVDYFASQGIKISEDAMPDDKMGKQLKSFTEWLKSMKKIQARGVPNLDEATNNKIQKIAEGSNVETDVVTEAMAEVLEKQGKSGKAIEVYKKLSLTDPSKSAYFAAQIERLKTP